MSKLTVRAARLSDRRSIVQLFLMAFHHKIRRTIEPNHPRTLLVGCNMMTSTPVISTLHSVYSECDINWLIIRTDYMYSIQICGFLSVYR